MKVTTKGQVTIPVHVRRFLGISPYAEVDFVIEDEQVILKKLAPDPNQAPAQDRFQRLRGSKRGFLTTEAWIEATRGE